MWAFYAGLLTDISSYANKYVLLTIQIAIPVRLGSVWLKHGASSYLHTQVTWRGHAHMHAHRRQSQTMPVRVGWGWEGEQAWRTGQYADKVGNNEYGLD